MQIEYDGNSFSFKKVFSALLKYKWINLSIIILTLCMGWLYYYLKHPIYKTSATIEIVTSPLDNRKDFFGNVIGRAQGVETEIDILKSEFLLNKTLRTVDHNIVYHKKYMLKSRLLYDDKPFEVTDVTIKDSKIFNKSFIVKHIDKSRFELYYKKSLSAQLLELLPSSIRPKSKIKSIKGVYRYGEKIDLPFCSFIINKVGLYKRAEYSFEFNRYDDVIATIKRNLSIKPASFKSSVLKITYIDKIPKRAQDFLNTYIENYLSYSKRNMVETDNKTLKFINEQLNLISGKLKNSEDSLQGYKKENSISDLDAQKREIVNRLSNFQEQLKNAEVELNIIKRVHQKIKNGKYSSISSLAEKYPVLNTMLQRLEDAKLDREKKLAIYTEYHPDVVSLTQGIKNLQKSIIEISKGILEKSIEKVNSLRKVVKEYTYRLKSLPKIEQELVEHKRLYTVNDKVYSYLLQKQSELSIEKASTILNKKVLDYAKKPTRRVSPRLSSVMATSLFLGFVLALLHTILRERLDTKIKDRYDILKLTDIPLFGLIPFIKDREKYNSAYVLDEPNSKAGEAFRSIKNNLEYSATDKKSKVILVTSSVPNEGKTTVSANLAAVLGMGEKRCIILSLDLRRPDLHHRFGLSNKVGMSDVLSNRVDIKDVTWENEKYKNFNIVTSGNRPPNPAELLASTRMKELLEELKLKYDYIVLDTPPFEYVNDAISLIKYADITLFVVKSEFSESKYIREIDKLVKKIGIENAGIILNSVKAKYNQTKKFDYRYIYHEA